MRHGLRVAGVVLGALVVIWGASLVVRPVHRTDYVVPEWPHIGVPRPADKMPRYETRSCGTPFWGKPDPPSGCRRALRRQRTTAEFTVLGGFLIAAAAVRVTGRREETEAHSAAFPPFGR